MILLVDREGPDQTVQMLSWPPFSNFLSTNHPNTSYQVSSQLAEGYMRNSYLKQIVDAAQRMMHNAQQMTDVD